VLTKSRSRLFFSALAAAILVMSSLTAIVLRAQSPDQVSIGVSPQSLDVAINPGDSAENVFRITNGSEASLRIEPVPKNFLPRGIEGAIDLLEDDTPYSLAKWISVQPGGPVSVGPRQTVDFTVSIDVPENADPGSYFGSVVFRTLPEEQEGSVALVSQEIAPVILVKVPGDVIETAEISSFRSTESVVTTNDQVEFELIMKNTGTVHFRPTGSVTIRNMWGQEVEKLELQGQNVIPEAERKMNVMWEEIGNRFGRYSADIAVVYGSDNQVATAQTTFYVFQYQKIIPVILILTIVGYLIYRMRKRLALAYRVLTGKQKED
jgi:hypothetical protein